MDAKSLIYQFDDVRVDLGKFEVFKAGVRVRLEPKAVETLVFLIENRRRLIEKRELLDAVWKDASVTENAMTRVIAQLRKVLGDDSKEAKYIETVPTRGYRFIADVKEGVEHESEKAIRFENGFGDREGSQAIASGAEQLADVSVAAVEPELKLHDRVVSRRTLVLVVCAMTVALAVVVAYLWILRHPKPSSDGAAIRSIAVLPFKPLIAASHNEYLEMGIADALISRLGSLKEIEVRPLSAVRTYTDPQQDAIGIGKTLEVDAVLDSSIQMLGDRIKIRTQLVRVTDGKQIWRFECDDKCAGIFEVQDSISEQMISALTLTLTAEEKAALKKRYTDDPETYRLYLMGRFFLSNPTEADAMKGMDYFQQVLAREPKYAPAYSGLADCYIMLVAPVAKKTPREGMPKARDAAAKAVALDDTLAEAHASLGQVRLLYDWDFSGAEREFKQSIDLSPNYPTAHYYYASYLTAVGHHDEAIKEATRAAELNPTSIVYQLSVGFHFYWARRYDEALEQFGRVRKLDPDHIPSMQINTYRHLGRYREAIAGFLELMRRSGASNQVVESFRSAFEKDGERGFWRTYIAISNRPWELAIGHAALNEKDKAFAQLEKLYDARSGATLLTLKSDPNFDNLRSDPRFDDLVRRIGIP